jgi:hypothetical protein
MRISDALNCSDAAVMLQKGRGGISPAKEVLADGQRDAAPNYKK